jgi:hypothetical protein
VFGDIPESSITSHSVEISETRASCCGWLERNRWLPLFLLCAVPFLVTLPLWIYHLSADPIWFFSGVVKDVRQGVNSSGLPFGDPNVGWTSEALGRLAAWQWVHGRVPWWNSYSGVGMPLAGEMQPGAFFLPFVLLFLTSNSFIWLRITMQLIAGFAMFALARELGLGRLASLVAGILFELNGTFAFTPGPDSVYCAAAFLPLLLLGIVQTAKREREQIGTLWIALAIGYSLLSGFPEVAYLDGLLALLWCICVFALEPQRWRFALRVAWGGLLGLLLAAPLLIAFLPLALQQSNLRVHHTGIWSHTRAAIPSMFVPYIHGPFPGPVEHIDSYVSLLVFFLALIGLQSRTPLWLRLLLPLWVLLAWAKTFGVKPVMTVMNHIPFLLETAFFRYSPPSWIFCLILLAAFGIEELRHRNPRLTLPSLITGALLAYVIHVAWPWRHYWHFQPEQIAALSRYFIFAVGGTLAALLIACFSLILLRGEARRFAISLVLVLEACILFSIPMLSAVHPGSVDWSAINFLKKHLGLSRFYTLGPIQPNYSAYFQIASLDYNSFPVPQRFSDFVTSRLFPPLFVKTGNAIFWPGAGFYDPNSGAIYLFQFLQNYQAMGVKYILTNSASMDYLAPQVDLPNSAEGAEALALKAGQQVQFSVSIPANPIGSNRVIRGFATSIGTYGNASDGNLEVRICAIGNCVQGSRPLSEAMDNALFYIRLSKPLAVAADTQATVTVTHVGGRNAVALWIAPGLSQQSQNLTGPDGKPIAGKVPHIAFSYDTGQGSIPRVYHDSTMNIFELFTSAPYYTVAQGGPCRFNAQTRESLHATCDQPALLVRRELYMPGWHASINGASREAKLYGEIFQAFELPRGDARVRFQYAPPFCGLGECLSLFAILALAMHVVSIVKTRRIAASTSA